MLQAFLAATPDAKEVVIEADWGSACAIGRQICQAMDEMDGFYLRLFTQGLVSQQSGMQTHFPLICSHDFIRIHSLMRIEYDVKLDFKMFSFVQNAAFLKSRSEVTLEREFKFKHTGTTWNGIPIIAANMDHTGTLAMANALSEHHVMTAMDKFITLEEWMSFGKDHKHVLPYSLSHSELAMLISNTSIKF